MMKVKEKEHKNMSLVFDSFPNICGARQFVAMFKHRHGLAAEGHTGERDDNGQFSPGGAIHH